MRLRALLGAPAADAPPLGRSGGILPGVRKGLLLGMVGVLGAAGSVVLVLALSAGSGPRPGNALLAHAATGAVASGHPQVVEPEAGVSSSQAQQNSSGASIPAPPGAARNPRAPSDADVRALLRQVQKASPVITLGGVFQQGVASVYGGPQGLACGGSLARTTLGVANKDLPCGTLVTFLYNGRSIQVPVIDRGPYIAGRIWDLTSEVARRLRFPGLGIIDYKVG